MTKPGFLEQAHVLVSKHINETKHEIIAELADSLGIEIKLIVAEGGLTQQDLDAIDIAFFSRDVFIQPDGLSAKEDTRLFFRMLDACSHLKWLHIFSAGSDRPKYRELQDRGVVITTSQAASGAAVATSALAGILALNKRLPWHYENQRARRWRTVPDEFCPLALEGQTAVVVGTGNIGAALARSLQSLNLHTIGVNRRGVAVAGFDKTIPLGQLDGVIGKADWLVICCPLTDETRNLIDARRLACLPRTAHLVNVGRGGIVDESALIRWLREKRLSGAYLDVFDTEPLPPDSEIWALENVMLTPHSAARVSDFNERVFTCFFDNLQRWLVGSPLVNIAA